MDIVSKESLGLRAEPFFNGFSDLIVVAPGFVAIHNLGQKVVSLCSLGNAVNAGSKHPFADTSGPQSDVLGPIVHKSCCIANVHEE